MEISRRAWNNYIATLRKLSDRAATEMLAYVRTVYNQGYQGQEATTRIIDYAYALATRYGEATGSAACDMYDAIALLQGAAVPSAVPAKTATISEVAKTVNGTMKTGNPEIVSSAVGRLVKLVGVDTLQQNALRDEAEWAWIPSGDTCAFCIMLASNGWQKASRKAIKGGHAEHVHSNCDCTYAVRFSPSLDVEGYDPDQYLEMYQDADGSNPEQKLNSMRREFYAENKDEINQQKRDAYAKRKALNEAAAEELNVN